MKRFWNVPMAGLMGLGLAFLANPASAAMQPAPGAVNYVEGDVRLDGQRLTSKAVGSQEVGPGQVIETGSGKAEILLTPGVFLRLGDATAVRIVNPGLTDTRVELLQGEALVEATDLLKQNRVQIFDRGASALLLKNGLYEFDAGPRPEVKVYDGKVAVTEENSKEVELGKGKETPVGNAPLHSEKFDRDQRDALYDWSAARSQYLAQANAAAVRTYVVGGYGYGWGPGWYWNPWGMYSFWPGDGFAYSPFGFGYYSPWYTYGGPVYFRGRGYYQSTPGINHGNNGFHGGAGAGGGMHSGGGGGFHGAGGGRHR